MAQKIAQLKASQQERGEYATAIKWISFEDALRPPKKAAAPGLAKAPKHGCPSRTGGVTDDRGLGADENSQAVTAKDE